MTNDKLGVLLIDVPEPKYWAYYFIYEHFADSFSIGHGNLTKNVKLRAYKCTQEEAKKYPQFRWVALEDL